MVFDEAHELEDVASSYFGLSVSNIRFEELARDTETMLRAKEGTENMPGLTQQLRDRARMFFSSLPANGDGRQPFDNREEYLEASGDLYLSLRNSLRLLESEMELLTDIFNDAWSENWGFVPFHRIEVDAMVSELNSATNVSASGGLRSRAIGLTRG